jgi:hypothetical protein
VSNTERKTIPFASDAQMKSMHGADWEAVLAGRKRAAAAIFEACHDMASKDPAKVEMMHLGHRLDETEVEARLRVAVMLAAGIEIGKSDEAGCDSDAAISCPDEFFAAGPPDSGAWVQSWMYMDVADIGQETVRGLEPGDYVCPYCQGELEVWLRKNGDKQYECHTAGCIGYDTIPKPEED